MNDDARPACPRCGHLDPAGTRFCTECGSSLASAAAPPPVPTGATCPRCGSPVGAGLVFCTECGQSLAAPAAAPSAAPPAAPPAQPSGPPRCASCGDPLTPGLRFCTSCGTPVGAPVVAAFPAASTSGHAPAGRRRWPWVVAALVLLAVVAGGAVAVLTRDDDAGSSDVATDRPKTDDDTTVAEPTPDSADDEATEADPDGTGVEVPSATAAPSTAAPSTAPPPAPAGATCWDGSSATTVDLCSRPQGLPGLTYVFPSLAGQACTTLSGSAPGRKLLLQCTGYLQDGTAIRINYSQWASVSAATEHYQGKGLAQTGVADGRITLSGYANTGELNTAWIYQKEPYSASVYASDQAGMAQALSTLVVGVPPEQVRGRP